MKINMFIVSLLALLKTLAVTFGLFFLLILIYSDTLTFWSNGEDIFIYIFLGLFFYSLAGIGYVFSILLPMYYIDRQSYSLMTAHQCIQHHAPIITLILVVFASLAALIAGFDGLSEGLVVANFFNTFVMMYAGLIFFEYQVHSAMDKIKNIPQGTQPL